MSHSLLVSPSVAIYLLGQRSFSRRYLFNVLSFLQVTKHSSFFHISLNTSRSSLQISPFALLIIATLQVSKPSPLLGELCTSPNKRPQENTQATVGYTEKKTTLHSFSLSPRQWGVLKPSKYYYYCYCYCYCYWSVSYTHLTLPTICSV